MPNKKISELTAAGALTGAESVEIVQGGANVKTTAQDIANLGGGGGAWGGITGTLADQTDLQNALNDKSDAGATIVTDTGAYTLQASDLTLINAGATLIIDGDGTDDLTVPLNATVAFPVGTFIGVRDYNNIVATGGVTITGTSGSLAIPAGMTATLEKTATNTWILHNGSGGGDSATETTEGIVELATAAEVITGSDTTRAVTAAGVHGKVVGVQDLYIPATAMWPKSTSGCSSLAKTEVGTSLLNIQTLDFDQTTQEFAQFTIVLPRKYDNGTITVVFYWTAAGGSGDVVWAISGGAYSNDDALSTALGTAVTVTDTLIAASDLHITSATSAMTLAGTPADADFLGFQISRNPSDGSDTLTSDARLLGVSLRITTDAAKDA